MSRIVDEPYFTYNAYNALTSGIQVKCPKSVSYTHLRIDRDCRRLMEWKPNGTMRLQPFELIQQESGIQVPVSYTLLISGFDTPHQHESMI